MHSVVVLGAVVVGHHDDQVTWLLRTVSGTKEFLMIWEAQNGCTCAQHVLHSRVTAG